MSTAPDRLLVVYPSRGNAFYAELASRLHVALGELGKEAEVISSDTISEQEPRGLRDAGIAAVNPAECTLSGPAFVERLERAPWRVAVLSEAAETRWYRSEVFSSTRFDGVLDIGFISQEKLHTLDAPYRFVFNGPNRGERTRIEQQSPGPRPLPWALVGHNTSDRIHLANGLLTTFDSHGFVFLPELRPVRSGQGLMSPAAVRLLLSKTAYYVWCSHHPYPYYESFRFLDSLLMGAVPCKIDMRGTVTTSEIPGVFAGVSEFASRVHDHPASSLFETARRFYLGQGALADHVGEALESL